MIAPCELAAAVGIIHRGCCSCKATTHLHHDGPERGGAVPGRLVRAELGDLVLGLRGVVEHVLAYSCSRDSP